MSKRIIYAAVALSGMALAADSGRDEAHVRPALQISGGTPIRLRLEKGLSSADARVNDQVPFAVREAVEVGGVVVIRKGSLAWGTVTMASPRGRMARSGKLNVDINAVCLADGKAAPLRAVPRMEDAVLRKSHADTGVGDSLIAFPAWPVLMFMYGKETNIAAGAEVTVYVDHDLSVDPAAVDASSGAVQCSQAPAVEEAPKSASSATVHSDPDGAEISIDGKYAGNTPSRLLLTPGEHHIVISLPGRQIWERNILVNAGGDISVAATLPEVRPTVGSRIEAAGTILPKVN